ncbi:MucBP domain-containing protein, partial [Enterococcus ureasiticus]|uniref:MucBP domain-containing protein n=1 Tax=Enterococcus ureasiticus TaxID=903984 RepID=UPI003083F9F4
TTPENTKVMAVPVTVTTEDETVEIGGKAGLSYKPALLTVSEIKGKTNADVIKFLTNRLKLKAWNLASGATLDATITSAPISDTKRGSTDIVVTIKLGAESLTQSIKTTVVPDEVFKNDEIEGWQNLPVDSDAGKNPTKEKALINPINGSRIGLATRGVYDTMGSEERDSIGFNMVDKDNIIYHFNGRRTQIVPGRWIPNQGQKPLYEFDKQWSYNNGVGFHYFSRRINPVRYSMRKGNKLKQVIIDDTNKVMYVYDIGMRRNLNFSMLFSMYNLDTTPIKFALFEPAMLQIRQGGSDSTIYAIGDNNTGFYTQHRLPGWDRKFSLKLKDNRGNWLSDFTKYKVGDGNGKPIDLGVFRGDNYFGNGFSKDGDETIKYKNGQEILTPSYASGYNLAAPWRDVDPDKAITGGYDLFFGDELNYMHLNVTPEEFNVYSDYTGDFNVDYKVSSIPNKGDSGQVYVTYPSGETIGYPFTGDNADEASGTITNIKDKLPKNLNENIATIKTYETSLIAVDETGLMNGLPSEEEPIVKINAYAFGGLPIGQVVKKGSAWTKTAESLIKDPTVLPGHRAAIEYVNKAKPVDTSKLGVQFAEVRMTDEKQTDKTVVIKVPVLVSDENPLPSKGLRLAADDFSVEKSELAGKTKAELEALILKKSGAVGFDLATGATTGIDLSILNTTLTNAPDATKTYTAEIQAKKGTATDKKTINITVTDQSTLAVTFVGEDNMELAPPINLTGNIGSKVDLTANDDIKKAIKIQTDKGYVVTRPPNEKAYEIDADENQTATYKFQTKSKLTIDFIDENNKVILGTDTVNLTKEIGVPVNLTQEKSVQDIVKKYTDKGYELLESPTPENAIPIEATDKTISYKFKTKSQLTINFIDEEDKVMISTETVKLAKEIGVPVDLTQEKSVQDIVKKYEDKGYKRLESPTPENAYPITKTDQTISYKFQTKTQLTINFVDEEDKVMVSTDTVKLTKELGLTVDLTKEKSVQDIVKKYTDKGYKRLESPTPENAYPLTEAEQTISYKFQTKSKLTINFIDETNDVLNTLEWTKEIGVPIDLSKDAEIIKVLSDLKADNRVLEKRPTNETSYPVGATDEPVEYRFRSNSKIIIVFFDFYDSYLNPPVELTKRIGSTINIREEATIKPVLEHLIEEKHFEMLGVPINDEAYVVEAEDKKIEGYYFAIDADLDVQFVDEKGDIVKELSVTRDTGSLDLTKDLDIQKAIKELQGDHYEVIERPQNEVDYPVRYGGDPIIYKVKKTTTTVTINFVDEEGGNIADVEPIKLTEIIGSTLELGVEPLKT